MSPIVQRALLRVAPYGFGVSHMVADVPALPFVASVLVL